jgi:hypothetical protein
MTFTLTTSDAQSYSEKRKAGFIAGSDIYASDDAFHARIARANKRRIAGLKRSLFADTKANRASYVESANFRFTPAPSEDGDLAPWIAAWPAAVLEAVAK